MLKISVAVVLKALVFPLAGRFGKKGIVHLLGKTGLTGPNVPKVSAGIKYEPSGNVKLGLLMHAPAQFEAFLRFNCSSFPKDW